MSHTALSVLNRELSPLSLHQQQYSVSVVPINFSLTHSKEGPQSLSPFDTISPMWTKSSWGSFLCPLMKLSL